MLYLEIKYESKIKYDKAIKSNIKSNLKFPYTDCM